jgi:hypothetical protein
VLGREEPDQASARHGREQCRGVAVARIDGRLVRHEPEATAAKQCRALMNQNLEAGRDARHAPDTSSVA